MAQPPPVKLPRDILSEQQIADGAGGGFVGVLSHAELYAPPGVGPEWAYPSE